MTTSTNYIAAAVGGQMYWGFPTGATDADKTTALNSRNLLESQISLNQTLALNGFYGSNANDTCDSSWVAGVVGAASEQKQAAGMPGPASCRIAPLGMNPNTETYDAGTKTCNRAGFTSVPVTSSSLCFTATTSSTANTVGIDNGKNCPSGANFVTPGTSTDVTLSNGNGDGFSLAAASGGEQVVTVALTGVTNALLVAGQSVVRISDVAAADITGAITPVAGQTCSAADVADLINGQHVVATSGTNTFTFNIPASTTCSAVTAVAVPNGSAAKVSQIWSPSCDSSNAFYQAMNPVTGAANAFGRPCPACSSPSSPTGATQWSFTGPNAGKFCSTTAMSGGVVAQALPQYPGTNPNTNSFTLGAGTLGTSCIAIDVNDQGAGNALTGTPMLESGIPYQTSVTAVFRTTSMSPIGSFASNSVLPYTAANSKAVAIDSEWKMPCSTPKINRAGTIVGALDTGSCNTQSLWWNGGTGTGSGTNGIVSDTETFGFLKSTFLAPFIGPSPAPAPAPVTPPPSPSPTPPSPTPVPPSPVSPVCTYKGTYQIRPLYAPCNKYYIASGTVDNCSYNLVNLRTKSQLGGKMARIRWAVATVAENGLSTPTNVVGEARIAAKGSCVNKNLAAPSDPSKGLKVGGSSWKWQIVPYPGSNKCDQVNLISQNRLSTSAFLQVPRSCDRFLYNNTDGGRQRFSMIKV